MVVHQHATDAAELAPGAGATNLVPWQDYQASRCTLFRSPDAFRWYQRQHHAELVRAGALAVVAGRVFVVPSAFDAAVTSIGQRLAAARAA